MGKSRQLGRGSVLHPANQRRTRRAPAFADKVAVSTGGHGPSAKTSPRRRGALAVEDGPRKGGVTVTPIDQPKDQSLTDAGRFRVNR